MKLVLRHKTHRYDRHRTLIHTALVPNIFEYVFLFRRLRLREYVGSGSKWREMSVNGQVQFHDVTDKKLIKQLQAWDNGEKFYRRNN